MPEAIPALKKTRGQGCIKRYKKRQFKGLYVG